MTSIALKIIEPEHNRPYFGTPLVTFRGAVIELPKQLDKVSLYFRWYSSINKDAKENQYSLNDLPLADPRVPFTTELELGSHIITFAVSDCEKLADMEAAKHGGVTGGSGEINPCVIHVFKANLIKPNEGDVLSRTATLIAEAPRIWGKVIPNTYPTRFEANDIYASVNRLRYRWEFIPIGAPEGRQTVNFIPEANTYIFETHTFESKDKPEIMTLRYTGELPANLTGDYRLLLHVEDKYGIFGGDEARIDRCSVVI